MDRPEQTVSAKAPAAPMRRVWKLLVAVPFSLCVALLTLEVAARVLPIQMFSMRKLMPMRAIDQHRFQPHPYSAFTPRRSWQTPPERKLVASHNSMGLRGAETTWQKPAGRFRIVCLGGSSTYGYTTTRDDTTYPVRLQAHLKEARPDLDVEVINCGAPGYTSFESMATLAVRAIAFEPDVVIVYHGINDAHAALYRSLKHPEAEVQVDNTHYRSSWLITSKSAVESTLERSYAFLVLRRYLTDYAEQQTRLNASLVVDNDLDNKAMFANPDPSPVGFANFQRNLQSIIGLAQAHGAQVMLATQATDYADFAKAPGDHGEAQAAGCERNGQTVRRVARQSAGVHLAEIAKPLEALAAQRKLKDKDDVFTSTVHFTNHGADLLAQMMATSLEQSGFLPDAE